MKRPTRDDCLRMLAAQADPAEPPYRWKIAETLLSEDEAVDLAELALLLRTDLSGDRALTAVLALARRLADLEEAFEVHDSPRRPSRHSRPQSGVAQPSDGGAWI